MLFIQSQYVVDIFYLYTKKKLDLSRIIANM